MRPQRNPHMARFRPGRPMFCIQGAHRLPAPLHGLRRELGLTTHLAKPPRVTLTHGRAPRVPITARREVPTGKRGLTGSGLSSRLPPVRRAETSPRPRLLCGNRCVRVLSPGAGCRPCAPSVCLSVSACVGFPHGRQGREASRGGRRRWGWGGLISCLESVPLLQKHRRAPDPRASPGPHTAAGAPGRGALAVLRLSGLHSWGAKKPQVWEPLSHPPTIWDNLAASQDTGPPFPPPPS